ncbi:tight adherence protein C [Micrococcales bacterium KH10]|nr:tight adherence protein C [Micrococcales bacterium KH10]
MYLDTTQLILMIVGTLLLIAWIVFFITGRKYRDLFANLDDKQHPLHEIYHVGYALLKAVRYSFRNNNDKELRRMLEILYEKDYGDYYLHALRAQQATMLLTLTIVSFGLYGFVNEPILLGLLLVCALTVTYYFQDQVKTEIRRRQEAIMLDFCDAVSLLALLTNAGMIFREAWRRTSLAGEGVLYKEMRMAVQQIDNGMPDVDAITNFGMRSMLPEVKKFSGLIVQGTQKGGGELPALLTAQSAESWHLKKQVVQRKSNKAGSMLLLPMILMFTGILILVIVPMFSGLTI